MKRHWSMSGFAICMLALLSLQCIQQQQPVPDTRVADEASIRDINPAWFKAYNAGDVNGIVALYAEDAVVSAPGEQPYRGQAEIREYFTKDIAASTAAGMTLTAGTTTDARVSGDIGWEWGTFTVTDKSGAVADRGKYLSVYAKKDGKWLMIRDIWNSDGPMQVAAAK